MARTIFNEAIEHYRKTVEESGKAGDKHMDGFLSIFKSAVPADHTIAEHSQAQIQGGLLNKRWDLTYGVGENRSQTMELKSIRLDNMGKWFNSRVEEAIGVATDLRFAAGDSIKLNYFLVVEDNLPKEKEQSRQKKLSKIKKFCDYIQNDLGLYDNVCCVVLSGDKTIEFHSDVETFIKKWSKKT